MLASPRFAEVKRLAGEAARRVETDEALQIIADVFWFTLEFGVIRRARSSRPTAPGSSRATARSRSSATPRSARSTSPR
jgi:phenylalanine-4-hydroxylase